MLNRKLTLFYKNNTNVLDKIEERGLDEKEIKFTV